ncbi:hypothetical protein [Streptomyces alkaliterrae]|uniref:Lipoprotein n=1 Tax=Streptomyces alkaliterrae TaxID=2213162 RepID=A0A5P0YSP3_9ACTN|nr:hypothetical protein [Streptomyces alkaliterrae]MBB1253207.1 hypothetical protein [Streptomyces alkaliterrae]MBB1257403.1 hypothetical protein [Streptomyces alkaliterrae]MQS03336.1 hypothetical protein [Streptomyces alkaliterrae]
MSDGGISRRGLLGVGAAALATMGIAGCSTGSGSGSDKNTVPGDKAGGEKKEQAKPIGDGSTADTGPQPHQPKPRKLEPGETPPQFVIFSWDGAGEVGNGLFPRFRKVAKDHGAAMTFFLSGVYLLPESKRELYKPPNNPVGASDIGYLKDGNIRLTLENLRAAWLEGHEVGTHFNGHFCGGTGSVEHWTPAQWRSEIDQAMDFVNKWRTNTGFTDLEPLPFDYKKELVGGRTPCLLGQGNLLPTAAELGWRYDSSSSGGLQMWPTKKEGVWDLPLQSLPFPGKSFEVLSMDYNILVNQSQNSTNGPAENHPTWRQQAIDVFYGGFRRAYESNRAPLFIGNHFEQWNGGIYMDAVEETVKRIADLDAKDVRMVSFRQFVDWLDAQDEDVLTKLRGLNVGQRPTGGWKTYLGADA